MAGTGGSPLARAQMPPAHRLPGRPGWAHHEGVKHGQAGISPVLREASGGCVGRTRGGRQAGGRRRGEGTQRAAGGLEVPTSHSQSPATLQTRHRAAWSPAHATRVRYRGGPASRGRTLRYHAYPGAAVSSEGHGQPAGTPSALHSPRGCTEAEVWSHRPYLGTTAGPADTFGPPPPLGLDGHPPRAQPGWRGACGRSRLPPKRMTWSSPGPTAASSQLPLLVAPICDKALKGDSLSGCFS